MSYLIRNTTVLQKDSRWRVVAGVNMRIANGLIISSGHDEIEPEPQDQLIDGSDLLLTPGLVNAHLHSAEVLSRGMATESDLNGWLARALPPIDGLSTEEIELAVSICAIDTVRSGVTTVIDHFRQMPARLDAGEAATKAWAATGMRSMVALMVRDRTASTGRAVDAEHAGAPPSTQACLEMCEGWLQGQGNSKVQRALGPSAPARCKEALLAGIAGLAVRHDVPIHMHVDETADQAAQSKTFFGTSSVGVLHRNGLLGPKVSLAHCVHIDADDIDMIAMSGATAIHCPAANMRLGSGIAPVMELLRSGANVALASDGAASNDGQSITEAMKLAFLASRVRDTPAAGISIDEILDMAFQPRDRSYFGQSMDTSQALASGAPADIAAFDLNDPLLAPLINGAAQFTLGGGALRARHVWVAGEMVLRDGTNLKCCEADVIREARSWGNRRNGGALG